MSPAAQCEWGLAGVAALRDQVAVLAPHRRAKGGQYSLSPASLLAIAPGTRPMLPSPNGSRLSLAGGTTPKLAGLIRTSQSGRELIDGGFPDDVEIALDLNVSRTAPRLC